MKAMRRRLLAELGLARTSTMLLAAARTQSPIGRKFVACWSAYGACQRRALVLMPERTKDPDMYPLGFIPLDGREAPETVYELLKVGHYVMAEHRLEDADAVHRAVTMLVTDEFPAETLEDYEAQRSMKIKLLRRVLIKRDFWSYSDFNDPELNRSYGAHNHAFDNYRWSSRLWKDFQKFAEDHFPISEHTHLVWADYVALQRYFKYKVDGMKMMPLLPRKHVLHPPLGVAVPSLQQKYTLLLYLNWLEKFGPLLMIKKALVVRAGCGHAAFATRFRGVPMVRATDPQVTAIRGCAEDAKGLGRLFRDMSFEVAAMFPELDPHTLHNSPNKHKYDLIVFHWDVNPMPLEHEDEQMELSDFAHSKRFAPGKEGLLGDLEEFFEQAGNYLTENGIVAIATTNLHGLAYPDEPNPIELEVKANRRWVILDYYDHSLSRGNAGRGGSFMTNKTTPENGVDIGTAAVQYIGGIQKRLRAELWILHRIEAIREFGWLHKVPGCSPPSSIISRWKYKGLQHHRMAMMKQRVELMGMDWGEYKDRLLRAMQDHASATEPEDDLAVSVRMALDPTYPAEVAEQSRRILAEKELAERRFRERVRSAYGGDDAVSGTSPFDLDSLAGTSPRDAFDRWSETQAPTEKDIAPRNNKRGKRRKQVPPVRIERSD